MGALFHFLLPIRTDVFSPHSMTHSSIRFHSGPLLCAKTLFQWVNGSACFFQNKHVNWWLHSDSTFIPFSCLLQTGSHSFLKILSFCKRREFHLFLVTLCSSFWVILFFRCVCLVYTAFYVFACNHWEPFLRDTFIPKEQEQAASGFLHGPRETVQMSVMHLNNWRLRNDSQYWWPASFH